MVDSFINILRKHSFESNPSRLSKVTDTEQFEFNKEVSVTNKAGLVPWSLALV